MPDFFSYGDNINIQDIVRIGVDFVTAMTVTIYCDYILTFALQ